MFRPMFKRAFLYCALVLSAASLAAQDRTLRVNYVFAGNSRESHIYVDDLNVIDGWAGRRVNLKDLYLEGNGQILMTDAGTGDTLYRNAFSTLFQEWQNTEEATRTDCSFENVFLLPMPKAPANVTVTLTDNYNNVVAKLTHQVNPDDILIRPVGQNPPKWSYIHHGGSTSDCIDVVILPEGYTSDQMDKFYKDAETAVSTYCHMLRLTGSVTVSISWRWNCLQSSPMPAIPRPETGRTPRWHRTTAPSILTGI